MCCLLLSFLCFKQKSAYEMRISDWSSDVCSSDLARALALRAYESSPNSAAGLFAMARANFYSGNCAGGNAMGEAALALNPYDADMSGLLGLFKLARSEERRVGKEGVSTDRYRGGAAYGKKKAKQKEENRK